MVFDFDGISTEEITFSIKVKKLKSERGISEVLSLLSVIFIVFSVNVILRTFVNVLIGLLDFSL